jgi:hypothetical protein
MKDVLERALARGDVDKDRLTPRVVRLPFSLVMHEVVITVKQISDMAIAEIVDQTFLPLVTTPR